MRLLLVEDDPFIALDLEMLVESMGHQVVGAADTYQSAVELAAGEDPDAAFVDLNLRDGLTGMRVARSLQARGMPVVFVTGNAEQLPPDFAGALGVVDKPFSHHAVMELLELLRHAREGGPEPATSHVRRARA